jgi:hypothetical protein
MSATPSPAPDGSDVARAEKADSPERLLGTLHELTADVQRRISAELQNAVEIHAGKFQEIYIRMREAVATDVRESLWQEFQIQLHRSMEDVRNREHAIAEELNRKEAEFENMNRETLAMIEDPDVEICRVIQRNVKQSELQGYIRGLRYSLGKTENTGKPE